MTALAVPADPDRLEQDLHIAVFDGNEEAFFDAAHAQALVEQWNGIWAGAISRDRAEGFPDAADRLTARVEPREHAQWRRHGPGGTEAVWTRVPEYREQHVRSARFTGFRHRRELQTGLVANGSRVRGAWDFQSWFTTLPVRRRVEFRPRGVIEVESYGVGQDAVEAAFTNAAADVPATPSREDRLDPVGVLKVLRVLHDGDGRRYSPFERGFHTDVRAAIACGLVDEEKQPPYRLLLTAAGDRFIGRHAVGRLPDPTSWEQPALLAAAVAELGERYAADTRGDPHRP
ncbi:hypothetical protein ACIP5N_21935 [Streptomyces sp. NPDC088768]|uniref:hypothetical protein n=1 Tax=Streptomyces sp. NPDC088768 TaxID=3365894 RepID=UPI00381973E0